jgi:hypothetical protein
MIAIANTCIGRWQWIFCGVPPGRHPGHPLQVQCSLLVYLVACQTFSNVCSQTCSNVWLIFVFTPTCFASTVCVINVQIINFDFWAYVQTNNVLWTVATSCELWWAMDMEYLCNTVLCYAESDVQHACFGSFSSATASEFKTEGLLAPGPTV